MKQVEDRILLPVLGRKPKPADTPPNALRARDGSFIRARDGDYIQAGSR